jgi:hypothetical protein
MLPYAITLSFRSSFKLELIKSGEIYPRDEIAHGLIRSSSSQAIVFLTIAYKKFRNDNGVYYEK